MFQSLRPNSPIYVFHKNGVPYLETGYVMSVSVPKPKYAIPTAFGQPQEMVVDIVVKINSSNVTFSGIPAQNDVADSFTNGEGITLSGSKEAMNAEILNVKQKSSDVIDSIDTHKAIISECDKILSDFNPEFAEKQKQKDEIDSLKTQMESIMKNMDELKSVNRSLLEKLTKNEESYENVGNKRK